MSEEKYHPPVARAAAKALCEAILDGIIEDVRRVARGAGYAIAVHGSVANDIDLIAIPWVERVATPDELLDRVSAVIAGKVGSCNPARFGGPNDDGWRDMPHGRRAINLTVFHGLFGHVTIDFGVMPSKPKDAEA